MVCPHHTDLLNAPANAGAIERDSDIVSAAQAGSPGAIEQLHAIYSRRLYKKVLAITRNREDAEDVVQDTFLKVYLAIDTFEGRSSIYSWLTRIAINTALMVLRRRRSRAEVLFDPQSDTWSETTYFEFKDAGPDPEQIYAQRQYRNKLLCEILNLEASLRTPLQMQMTKGVPIKEIGRALNLSEGAVKARLHRARIRLSAACRDS